MMTRTCETCKYWDAPEPRTGITATCKRYPPTVNMDGSYRDCSWPITSSEDWCGEYEWKPEQ